MVDDNKRDTTAIQVTRETWQLATELKDHPSVTMDEVVSRALRLYKQYITHKQQLQEKLEQEALSQTFAGKNEA